MRKILTLPFASYPVGGTLFGPIALPDGMRGCEIHIARCTTETPGIWDSSDQKIHISIDVSYDGGVSYQVGQFSLMAEGGITSIKGRELPETIARFGVHPQIPTHVRGTITVSGGQIHTALSIQTD